MEGEKRTSPITLFAGGGYTFNMGLVASQFGRENWCDAVRWKNQVMWKNVKGGSRMALLQPRKSWAFKAYHEGLFRGWSGLDDGEIKKQRVTFIAGGEESQGVG